MQQQDSQIELESQSSMVGDDIGRKLRNKNKSQPTDAFSMQEGELLLNASVTQSALNVITEEEDDQLNSKFKKEPTFNNTEQLSISKRSNSKRPSQLNSQRANLQDSQRGSSRDPIRLNKSQNAASVYKSVAGFDMGQVKSQGSFFTAIRQKQEKEDKGIDMENFIDTSQMKSKKFLASTIQSQAQRYEKKFAFEKGQYHQCIPNPKNDKQRITVQIVERVLKESVEDKDTQVVQELFKDEQSSVQKERPAQSQTYERYTLVMPEDQNKPQDEKDESDNDDEDSKQEINDSQNLQHSLTQEAVNLLASQKTKQSAAVFGEYEPRLYYDSSLMREPDQLLGIQHQIYADIKVSRSNDLAAEARQNCEEFAVIAFWDLNEADDVFTCNRFFVVPNPQKRRIKNVEDTIVYQVLFISPHTQDVFFFWKGNLKGSGSAEINQLQLSFVELEFTQEQLDEIGERRIIDKHVSLTIPIKSDTILEKYVKDLHDKPYDKQNQLPNPTMIEELPSGMDVTSPLLVGKVITDNSALNSFRDSIDKEAGRYLVFTAFLVEKYASFNKPDAAQNQKNKVYDCWYPTIYFYDLVKQEVVWEIFGAEQFISILKKKVRFFTNEVWFTLNQSDWEQKVQQEDEVYSRFDEHYSYINDIRFGAKAAEDQNRTRRDPAPQQLTERAFRLNFNKNNNLQVTEPYKVVEAYSHSAGKRVTLLYPGLGSFTFQLKKASSLNNLSLWKGNYYGQNFNCKLKISKDGKNVNGEGKDENNQKVTVKGTLNPQRNVKWIGFFETDEVLSEFVVPQLKITKNKDNTPLLQANWVGEDGSMYQIESIVDQGNQDVLDKSIVRFKLTISSNASAIETRIFEGQIDPLWTEIDGECSSPDSEIPQFRFHLNQAELVPGNITVHFEDRNQKVELPIEMDYGQKAIRSPGEQPYDIEIVAIDAVDQAEITYAILYPDVTYLNIKNTAYVQGKLIALQHEDENTCGKGVAETVATLYNVDFIPKKEKEDATQKLAVEPRDRQKITFYINQTFLQAQENESQMFYIGQSSVSYVSGENRPRIFGSVLYEENGSDAIKLNMFTADIGDEYRDTLVYQQEPVPQSWIVDYPLLAYKTFGPRNREISIVHMAQDMPQRMIHLGDWEFVCFVNHTQMVEQKLFQKTKETNCDIMILVKRKDEKSGLEKCRLMSFKSNPWLRYDENPDENDLDIVKQSFFIFSGDIGVIPTTYEGQDVAQNEENHQKFKQRFNNDKIQTCQLITKTLGTQEQFMLLIQFNDTIVQASLNKNFFELIAEPEQMLRRHLVRGYNEKVYYCESSGSVDKVCEIEFHPTKPNQIKQESIYQLSTGWIVAFEPDDDNIQNDLKEVPQSLFILDDHQKIINIKNEDNVRFEVSKVFDISHHEKAAEIFALRDNNWVHVHMSERALTFDQTTYNLQTDLAVDIDLPKYYFGKETQKILTDSLYLSDDEEESEDMLSDDETRAKQESEKWWISSVQGMSMTTNMIIVGQKNQREFCFVLKPAPGSRKLSIVGFQQQHEIQQMLFVSNAHILLKLRGRKTVTLLSNGSIVHQDPVVQAFLDQSGRVIGESQVYRGLKTVLLEDEYAQKKGEKGVKVRHIAVQFSLRGQAELVGIFYQYRKQMKELSEKRDKALKEEVQLYKEQDSAIHQNSISIMQLINQATNQVNISMEKVLRKQVFQNQDEIRYTKEWFITENGEVIKMGAIVTPNPKVEQRLKEQELQRKSDRVKSHTRNHYISIFKIKNAPEQLTSLKIKDQSKQTAFTVIIFHTLNPKEQERFARETQYCVVGNYLCHRRRDRFDIWVTKLKEKSSHLLQFGIDENNINTSFFQEKESKLLSIFKMTKESMLPHVQLTEVPEAYFQMIKARNIKQQKLEFYSNLLQITIGTNGIIYDLDSQKPHEVNTIENIDQLMNPDKFINTGFIMSMSHWAFKGDIKYNHRVQLLTNEYCNLIFEKDQKRFEKGKPKIKISGLLYRTFSELDLWEVNQIMDSILEANKINSIDPESILCTYEGHTVFSLFFDRIRVYEQILTQLQEMEFLTEEDVNDIEVENGYIRRLYRVLNIPTGDLKGKLQSRDSLGQITGRQNRCQKFVLGLCRKNEPSYGQLGFKSVQKKSLHFKNSRFRENLMQMAILCRENSIDRFVDNMDDIEIIFMSMSPAEETLLDNAFKQTRFTDQIKNADWRVGKNLEVIGDMTSIMTEKDSNKKISGRQKAVIMESGDIQNRQVESKMLQIDWVFAEYGGKEKGKVGFADFVLILSKTPYEALYSTDFVKAMTDHFWKRYQRHLLLKCAFPYLIYQLCTIYYTSEYALQGVDSDHVWDFTWEFFIRCILIILNIYFVYFEIRDVMRDGISYLFDPFNYLDVLKLSLNMYLIGEAVNGKNTEDEKSTYLRGLAATAVVLTWFKSFYWLRLFDSTSFYVRLIVETIFDIKYFIILFVIILLTFGNALYILSIGREDPLYRPYTSNNFINVVLNQYELSLGEFDTEVFITDSAPWIVFFLATLITQVTFLNMLIAIMGDSYSRVIEVKQQSALVEKIQILSDYVDVVPYESEEKGTLYRFLFTIKPKALGAGEGEDWEGTTQILKTAIEKNVSQAIKSINGKMATLTSEVNDGYKKIEQLEKGLSDLQGSIQSDVAERMDRLQEASDRQQAAQERQEAMIEQIYNHITNKQRQ